MLFARIAAATLFLAASQSAKAAPASVDDNAKFLAGVAPSSDSPLTPLTKSGAWQGHSRFFERTWAQLEAGQIAKVRAWSEKNVPQTQPVLFYIFSGPDFLYADALFPRATTYVMAGLEPPGQIPDVAALPQGSIPAELQNIEASLSTLMRYSFFITKDMRVKFQGHRLTGTLPALYVFMARAGKTVRETSLIVLDKDGAVHPAEEAGVTATAKGAKIVFSGSDGSPKTLYYFQTDVSNDGAKKSGFLTFCEKLGTGNAFLKSASYLLHSGNFTTVRDFLLKQSVSIVQDDSGVPLRNFDTAQWNITPYGRYTGPIALFAQNYQRDLTEVFRRAKPEPLGFGIGYRIRAPESSLIIATKKSLQTAASQQQ